MKVWHEQIPVAPALEFSKPESRSPSRSSSALSSDDVYMSSPDDKHVRFAAQHLGPTLANMQLSDPVVEPKSILKYSDPRYAVQPTAAEQRHKLLLGAAIEATRRVKAADAELTACIDQSHPTNMRDATSPQRRIELYANLQRYRNIEIHALSEELLFGDKLQKPSKYHDAAQLEVLHQKMYAEFYLAFLSIAMNDRTERDLALSVRLQNFIQSKQNRLIDLCGP